MIPEGIKLKNIMERKRKCSARKYSGSKARKISKIPVRQITKTAAISNHNSGDSKQNGSNQKCANLSIYKAATDRDNGKVSASDHVENGKIDEKSIELLNTDFRETLDDLSIKNDRNYNNDTSNSKEQTPKNNYSQMNGSESDKRTIPPSENRQIIIYEQIIYSKSNENTACGISTSALNQNKDLSYGTNDADNEMDLGEIMCNYQELQMLTANDLEDGIILDAPEEFRSERNIPERQNPAKSNTSDAADAASEQVPPEQDETTNSAIRVDDNRGSPEAQDTSHRTTTNKERVGGSEKPTPSVNNTIGERTSASEACSTSDGAEVNVPFGTNSQREVLTLNCVNIIRNLYKNSVNALKFLEGIENIVVHNSTTLVESDDSYSSDVFGVVEDEGFKVTDSFFVDAGHVGSTCTTPTEDLNGLSCLSNMQLEASYESNQVSQSSVEMDCVHPEATTNNYTDAEIDTGCSDSMNVKETIFKMEPNCVSNYVSVNKEDSCCDIASEFRSLDVEDIKKSSLLANSAKFVGNKNFRGLECDGNGECENNRKSAGIIEHTNVLGVRDSDDSNECKNNMGFIQDESPFIVDKCGVNDECKINGDANLSDVGGCNGSVVEEKGMKICECGRARLTTKGFCEGKCAGHETAYPSIASECAKVGGCSLSADGKACASPAETASASVNVEHRDGPGDDGHDGASSTQHLAYKFRNGRLVFETVESKSGGEQVVEARGCTQQSIETDHSELSSLETTGSILYSKDLNKRVEEGNSRLKVLEEKLKQAGITDDKTKILDNSQYDSNHNTIKDDIDLCNKDKGTCNIDKITLELTEENLKQFKNDVCTNKETDLIPSETDFLDFCQFDVRQIENLPDFKGYVELYDEFDSSSSEENYIIMRETPSNMGTETERNKHNPDKDNLKSLLKKPGRIKDKKNRVIFNENKNEFFDADYIILIREECDFDEDDDDSICTCNQHEMVRLQCCEPNCNCMYDGYDQTPQSPKFAPPMEFVDAVTLSPPEGYKDMELGEQQLLALQQMARRSQRAPPVCRECRECRECSHEDEDENDEIDVGVCDAELSPRGQKGEEEETEKTDQSQQTTPTTPPNDSESDDHRYILETITMTTVTEQRMLKEVQQETEAKTTSPLPPVGGSPISGILKGGRLWKQQSLDAGNAAGNVRTVETQQVTDSDDDSNSKRSVRFIEMQQDKRDSCDGASDNTQETEGQAETNSKQEDTNDEMKPENFNSSPESTEMTLTFKLGNHVLISNNSLKPNSAVRQLFPCTKPLPLKGQNDDEAIHQYLVTAESLKAFEEAKRSKLPQMIQSGETDESIKRAIERNTLRRSLIRYEPKSRKNVQKTDNSLVERIKLLTCDVDEVSQEEIAARVSPPGEEARNSPEINNISKNHDKSFSPSSSSTASSNSSSMSSTYKKITDLFGKRDSKIPDVQNNLGSINAGLPDLGGPNQELQEGGIPTGFKPNMTNDSRRQFLSTLAPLTACVSSISNTEEYYYHMSNQVGERSSMASSIGTEYSLEDIDEGLKNGDEEVKRIAPDVLVGTPSASESGDELAMFVQQDASRIERIKKKYQPEEKKNDDEDDEHDDYGFNRRPTVRGIKPRFGSTTEILQQIQNQLQPPLPNRVNWPYYSESGLDNKSRTSNQNMPNYQVPEEVKARNFGSTYRPTSLQDENLYQNCASNQRCVYRNVNTYSSVMRVGGGCNEYYQSLPRSRSNSGSRPQSPPPLEVSKYHQTMVYIPYNHIEGYQQPNPYYPPNNDYVRVSNQNQINKRYAEPIYQQRIHPQNHPSDYNPNMMPPGHHKPVMRMPYINGQPSPHLITSRSESPLPGQFSTARATQTGSVNMPPCNFYAGNPRYRPMVGPIYQGEGTYVKTNRHSFPAGNPRYVSADSISLTDSDSVHSGQMPPVLPNGYTSRQTDINFPAQKDSVQNSPTKSRFIERGVPEGAASVSPQDSTATQSSSTMTSPTSPQNPPQTNQKPLFYAMNV